ncbi:MAG: hypothetical protein EPN51_26955 [Mycobacterium sp.]|nr:MAG: hypothetical protein EPN51_26955 [Mycobacterium sp.]
MLFRGCGETRRWQPATAIVAALGVFVALVAGSSLQPPFAASTLPEPAAWSGATPDVDAPAGVMHPDGHFSAISRPALAASRSSTPAHKTNTKPFHYMWMTKERPLTWNRLSPHSALPPTPVALGPSGSAPYDAQSRAPAGIPADRDILTRLCIARV